MIYLIILYNQPIMKNQELLERYNYDSFVPEKFNQWMRFHESPPAGTTGPDFPLWDMNQQETSLSKILSASLYTIVEFGSFT